MATNKAFIIGNGYYANKQEFPNIPYCHNDAKEVFRVLCKEPFSIFDESKSKLLIDSTLAILTKELDAFFNEVETNDLILFYFAGHGKILKGKSFHIIMEDTLKKTNLLSNSSFNIEALLPYLNEKDVNKYVIILDACRAGKAVDTPGFRNRGENEANLADISLGSQLSGEGKVLITASQDYENSLEVKELKHGVFSYYFIKGIENGISDDFKDSLISIREIYRCVNFNIRENHPNIGQKPVFSGPHMLGEIFVAKTNKNSKLIDNPENGDENKNIKVAIEQSGSISYQSKTRPVKFRRSYNSQGLKLRRISIYLSLLLSILTIIYGASYTNNILDLKKPLLISCIPIILGFFIAYTIPLFHSSHRDTLISIIDDIKLNIRKVNKLIGTTRGQMHKIRYVINENTQLIGDSTDDTNPIKDSIGENPKRVVMEKEIFALEEVYTRFELQYRFAVDLHESLEAILEYTVEYLNYFQRRGRIPLVKKNEDWNKEVNAVIDLGLRANKLMNAVSLYSELSDSKIEQMKSIVNHIQIIKNQLITL